MVIIVCAMWSGCDPTFSVEYAIENKSSTNIMIISSNQRAEKIDTNNISPGTKLILQTVFGIGETTENYLNELVAVPFSELNITKNDNSLYNKNALDVLNWDKLHTDKNNGIGKVELRILGADFD